MSALWTAARTASGDAGFRLAVTADMRRGLRSGVANGLAVAELSSDPDRVSVGEGELVIGTTAGGRGTCNVHNKDRL